MDMKALVADLHVLVVDDQVYDREIVKAVLAKLGVVRIETVDSGTNAVTRIQNMLELKVAYDLVFLDWRMPVRDGKSTLALIRRQAQLAQMGVFIMTATSDVDLVKSFIKAGANDFIIKPVLIEVLKPKLERYLEKKAKLKAA
jgi:two-component system sensor histidine kinase/response regulator